jgi:OmpA-OmpF porin, OOP family
VYNPSFEEYDECPDINGINLKKCIGWFNPTNPYDDINIINFSSPDYYNICYNNQDILYDTPGNFAGQQNVKTGVAYTGVLAGFGYDNVIMPGDEQREYIEGQLTVSLKPGKKYCVEFYVSLAGKYCNYTQDRIGVHFSNDSLLNIGSLYAFLVPPQIENEEFNFISDTTNWIKISGTFTAIGGERYITIGNFRKQDSTNYLFLGYSSSQPDYVYYYIDDVSVTECGVGIEETPTPPTYLYPNPTTNTVTLSYTFKQAATIEIYSINGACLLKQPIQAGTQNPVVDVSNLANGLYVVRAYTTTQPLFNQRLAIVK